jgi:phosphatidylserine decarboxylase
LIVACSVTLFVVFFFRDPDRGGSVEQNAVLSPADGTILSVQRLEDGNNPLGEPAVKVSIFMSVFNVHVNRIPTDGIIKDVEYRRGRFLSANLDKASEDNENNRITIETSGSRKIVVIQIAGLIARRIACWVKENDHVVQSQRFGLIRFGSRLEVYLPISSEIISESRKKVRAGETIIGYLL